MHLTTEMHNHISRVVFGLVTFRYQMSDGVFRNQAKTSTKDKEYKVPIKYNPLIPGSSNGGVSGQVDMYWWLRTVENESGGELKQPSDSRNDYQRPHCPRISTYTAISALVTACAIIASAVRPR